MQKNAYGTVTEIVQIVHAHEWYVHVGSSKLWVNAYMEMGAYSRHYGSRHTAFCTILQGGQHEQL